MRSYKKLINAIVALLAVSVLIFASACMGADMLQNAEISSVKDYSKQNDEARYLKKRADTKGLASGDTELYIDSKNGAISIYDIASQKSWNSLPTFQNSFASNFTVKVFYKNELHVLDTSGCLDEAEGMTYSVEGNTLKVDYNLKAEDITLSFSVLFSINGGYLEVSVDASEFVVSEGARIISIAFLPYLGAVKYDVNNTDYEVLGDYFLVPDGPGAKIYTAVENDVHSAAVFSVYGKDYYEESIPVSVGAYGIKSLNCALAVTVTEGAENSLIRVFRSNADENAINRIYPEFIITDISGDNGKVNLSKNSFNGKMTVVYETLSDENADYMGMAVSVRQALINAGMLKAQTVEDEYPLFVSVIGSVDDSRSKTAASLQQAENLLSILKGKGINEINMILEGFFSGGLDENSTEKLKPSGKLGGEKDLLALCDYANKQQLNVFAGIELLSSDSIFAAKNISGDKKEISLLNPLYPFIGQESITRKYASVSGLNSSFADALEAVEDYAFSGLCVLGSNISCIADYSSENGSFSDYSDILVSNISASRVNTKLMLDGANINILKYADYIKEMPLTTVIPESGDYVAVPFVPAVLHSSCIYAGEAANNYSVPRLNLLKSVEYGAVPYYIWVFSSESDKYYDNTLSEAVDFYLTAKKELGDLSSRRITDHYLYEDGVYCTIYDGGTKIYVNYNNYSVVIGEVAVMPYDYLRIG